MTISQESKPLLPSQARWFRTILLSWGNEHLRDFPWRHTENSYELLVAEFLLQQTDAPRAVPVYEAFLRAFPKVEALAAAEPDEIAAVIQPLGFHFRARHLSRVGRILAAPPHHGDVPKTETELLKLPGVGLYIARAVCANAKTREGHLAIYPPLSLLSDSAASLLDKTRRR